LRTGKERCAALKEKGGSIFGGGNSGRGRQVGEGHERKRNHAAGRNRQPSKGHEKLEGYAAQIIEGGFNNIRWAEEGRDPVVKGKIAFSWLKKGRLGDDRPESKKV